MTQKANPGAPSDRPFPWKCPSCLKCEVFPDEISYTAEIKHDGILHSVHLPALRIPKCRSCGEVLFGDSADEQINSALRSLLRLLTPVQIRKNRRELELSQSELAERLGTAEATISRWETGALIQSRAMDNLLRVYFALPEARAVLQGKGQAPWLGEGLDCIENPPDAPFLEFSHFSRALRVYGRDGLRAQVEMVREQGLLPIY
jgi:putative zinc finger/helix-turn-helix YgiT family protein